MSRIEATFPKPKKLDLGTILYPADMPDIDKQAVIKAIYAEINRQMEEYHARHKEFVHGDFPGVKYEI